MGSRGLKSCMGKMAEMHNQIWREEERKDIQDSIVTLGRDDKTIPYHKWIDRKNSAGWLGNDGKKNPCVKRMTV